MFRHRSKSQLGIGLFIHVWAGLESLWSSGVCQAIQVWQWKEELGVNQPTGSLILNGPWITRVKRQRNFILTWISFWLATSVLTNNLGNNKLKLDKLPFGYSTTIFYYFFNADTSCRESTHRYGRALCRLTGNSTARSYRAQLVTISYDKSEIDPPSSHDRADVVTEALVLSDLGLENSSTVKWSMWVPQTFWQFLRLVFTRHGVIVGVIRVLMT